MKTLCVTGLNKTYDHFSLQNVSFALNPGEITGFIGRNGAGKTTTLKSLLNFVHPDSGDIQFFGMNFYSHEYEIKQRIGFVSGGIQFYPKKKLRVISDVMRRFYQTWDQDVYLRYLAQFELNEQKTPDQLSAGMKVKYALALALSHHAELLILDEPTSGLDPVSRDDLLDIFMNLVETEKVSILFSTHITSDLEKCADHIIYIKKGKILADSDLDSFLGRYKIVESRDECDLENQNHAIGVKKIRNGYQMLVEKDRIPAKGKVLDADLESIMVHLEKE